MDGQTRVTVVVFCTSEVLYISMMFHENILEQFSSNRVDTICDRQTDRQSDGQPNKAKTIML